MKINLSGLIDSMERVEGVNGEKLVRIELSISGSVEGRTLDSKKASLDATLTLKPIVASQLRLGTILYVSIMDDESAVD